MKIIILSAMKSTKSRASSAALCLVLGAANIHAQDRPPAGDQSESDLQQIRQRMMDRRHQDFPEQDGSAGPERQKAEGRRHNGYEGRFQDGPAGPGGAAPFMRDEGRGFGHPGWPGAFRAQRDGGPGFPPPPMSGGRSEWEGFGPYPGDMDGGSRYEGRFQDGPAASGRQKAEGRRHNGYEGRFQDGPAGPGGAAPFMRDEGRGFGHPGRPGAFRAQRDGGPGFPPPPMSGGWSEREGFGPYPGGMDQGSRYEGRFQDGPAAPGGPAPFMRDGGCGFGHPGRPGAFRAQRDGGPGFPPPPMSGGRSEWQGFGPYPGDVDQGSRYEGRFQEGPAASGRQKAEGRRHNGYEGRFQEGPAAPGSPAPFMRDGGRGFGHPGWQRQPEDE
jgi:hypothetical protein